MTAKSDNRHRYEQCVSQCADAMYRVAFRLTGNSTHAVDLVQETYLQAWNSIDRLKNVNRMRAWMFSILRNQYSKFVRSESNHRIVAMEGELAEVEKDQTEDRDLDEKDRLQAALNRLEDSQKVPLVMVVMEGLTVDEVASLLELPRGTVLSRIHRAKLRLRELLKRTNLKSEIV